MEHPLYDRKRQHAKERFTWAVMVVVLLGALELVWVLADLGGEKTQLVGGNLIQGSAAFAAAVSCAFAAVRSHGRLRHAWLLLSLAAAAWGMGQATWTFYELVRHEEAPSPSVADVGFLGLVPLGAAGMFSLATVPKDSAAKAKALLDGLTICAVLLFPIWAIVLSPIVLAGATNRAELLLNLSYPLGDVAIGAVGLSVLLGTGAHRRLSYLTTALLGAWLAFFMLADVFYAIGQMNETYETGSMADAGWVIGFLCLALAAAYPFTYERGAMHAPKLPFSQALPGLAAAIVLSIALARVQGSGALDAVSVGVAAFLVICVIVRQFIGLTEVQRLTRMLEARVADRTAQLSRREQQFKALVQHSSDVIVIVRSDGGFEYVSPSVHHVLGMTADELIHGSIDDLVCKDDRQRVTALLAMSRRRSGATMTAEWRVARSDGTLRQVEVLVRNLLAEPAVAGIVLNLRDVTERKELEDQLIHQAHHDDLTGLPNRSLLRLRIEQSLGRWLFQAVPFSLLVVDLDDFKSINDSLGHVAGDRVLKVLAQRIGTCTRRGDVVVRLGGDEFAVLLEGVAADDQEARNLVERIIDVVSQPIPLDGRSLALGASAGMACVTDQVTQADDILRNADLALHTAKSTERGGWVQFEVAMYDSALRRVELEADLRRAIERDELLLHYQPTVDIATGRLEGVEALLRWPHPEKGYISPADFIPLAEESGLIVPIGTWVLKHACNEVRKWQARYPTEIPLQLNVNLSGRQLDAPDVVDTVRQVINDSGIASGSLCLEMTESVLMENKATTLAKMQELVDLGCKLAIDDFGTGYSSLSYLRQFPIGVLKIDRSFVNGVGAEGSEEETALVQAIVDLARTLQLQTVAEGIETADQLDELRRMGCDVGQGFYLARPQPAEDVRRLLERLHSGEPVAAMRV